MSEDNEAKLYYINGKQAKDSPPHNSDGCRYDPESGEHLKNIAGSLDRLEKVVEVNLSSLADLASGKNQIGVYQHFLTVGGLFGLLVIMFLYFTGQQAKFSNGSFEVHPNNVQEDKK